MANIKRLNHAVLYVSDLERSVSFYKEAFGFEEIARLGQQAVFLRAAGSDNHHDLGLFSAAAASRPPRGAIGLYHLAWQVATVADLATMAGRLADMNALGGMSDHGATLSLYGTDPDGIEFEVMWMLPRDAWGEFEREAVVRPLDLQKAVAKFANVASAPE